RVGLAVSLETQPLRRDARLDQIVIYGSGTAFRQLLVVGFRAGVVGMATDFDQHLFIQVKKAGELIQVTLGLRQQGISIGFEENVVQCRGLANLYSRQRDTYFIGVVDFRAVVERIAFREKEVTRLVDVQRVCLTKG